VHNAFVFRLARRKKISYENFLQILANVSDNADIKHSFKTIRSLSHPCHEPIISRRRSHGRCSLSNTLKNLTHQRKQEMKIRFLSTGLEQRTEATIGLLAFCFRHRNLCR